MKPSYTASIGEELEDGLFDGNNHLLLRWKNDYMEQIIYPKHPSENGADFLELALQFGMIMMFACAFPLVFCFATLVRSFWFLYLFIPFFIVK